MSILGCSKQSLLGGDKDIHGCNGSAGYTWCGPCQMLSPILEELSNEEDYKSKLSFAKVSTEDFPELAQQNNVLGIPCLILFNKGKEASRIVGYAPRAVIKAKINSALESLNKFK